MYREVNKMPKCAFCGILVPCKEVVARVKGEKYVFCRNKCVEAFKKYKLPKYGDKALEEASIYSKPKR